MKNLLLILLLTLFFSCTNSENNKNDNTVKGDKFQSVSFVLGQKNISEGIVVAFTNDIDSLWLKKEWTTSIKNKMKNLSSTYSTVLLFNKEENIPKVAVTGMDYSLDYDKNMVCGYWIYPSGTKQFCFGGIKDDGNFKKCEQL